MSLLGHRRGQTSLELLLILSIILFGIAVVIPNYLSSSTSTSLISLTRSSADVACGYLDMGVIVRDTNDTYFYLNQLLNPMVKYDVHVGNVRYAEVNDTIYIKVNILSFTSLPNEQTVENGILNFIRAYIVEHSSARIDANNNLIYNGKKVIINVEVRVQ
ncbi:hypothetical protein [Thermococcus sp.]